MLMAIVLLSLAMSQFPVVAGVRHWLWGCGRALLETGLVPGKAASVGLCLLS